MARHTAGPAAKARESKLIRLLGSRGASAVMGFFILASASGQASAQAVSTVLYSGAQYIGPGRVIVPVRGEALRVGF